MKYRKKPVVIDAMQWTGKNVSEISEFMSSSKSEWFGRPNARELVIETLEGNHTAKVNDWIIIGVQGEAYPCKPDIFEQTYELVGDPK